MSQLKKVLGEVEAEMHRATKLFGPFRSAHEGYAILLEEMDELWEEIKRSKQPGSMERMREEAIQIAAMAVRFVVDLEPRIGGG